MDSNSSKEKQSAGSLHLFFCTRWSRKPPSPEVKNPEKVGGNLTTSQKRKPGGWKAMPFILGNETFERLATFGLLANFMVYLMREFHMEQVAASNVINIWAGFTNFAPLVGAFMSDAYAGRFRTIVVASVASFLGMLTVTLTAWLPQLHPPGPCKPLTPCPGPNRTQLGVLILGLGFLSIGAGGIRPCSIPFGIDQFDPSTEEGVKGIASFFNWYYATFTVVILITQTLVVYIQDSLSWVLGFGIPTLLMFCSIVLFLVGTKIYVYVQPEGSVFTGILRVLVAAYKKRKLKLPDSKEESEVVLYDPPSKRIAISKLTLTNQFRLLNRAAIITENDPQADGTHDKWRLCSIQQVEEVKCLIRIIPIWASGILSFTSMAQQGTFTVSQALKMDRHLGPNFQIPAGSIGIISMITIGVWIPIYDRLLVPSIQKVTKLEGGITVLQRTGVGIVFSILAMIVAGLIEKDRRVASILHPEQPISVLWLAPQLVLMGFSEAFTAIGQIEFFNNQFPEHMRSLGNALVFASIAGASYLSSLLVNIVHQVTRGHGNPDWLDNDINAGKLDFFYYLVAALGFLNFVYFLYCADRYRYKGSLKTEEAAYPSEAELRPINP